MLKDYFFMVLNKKLLITFLLFLFLVNTVHADLVGPEILIFGLIALLILGVIVIGVFLGGFLILKWIKNKYAKK